MDAPAVRASCLHGCWAVLTLTGGLSALLCSASLFPHDPHTHTQTCTHVHIHSCTLAYTYTGTPVHICTYTYTCTHLTHAHTPIGAPAHTHTVHICTRSHLHTHPCIVTLACLYAHLCTRLWAHSLPHEHLHTPLYQPLQRLFSPCDRSPVAPPLEGAWSWPHLSVCLLVCLWCGSLRRPSQRERGGRFSQLLFSLKNS